MPFPFEVPFDDVEDNLDTYVTEIFSCLQSEFLTLPKGPGFVEYSAFMGGYEALKRVTGNFRDLSPEPVIKAFPFIHEAYPAALKKFQHSSGVKRSQISPMASMS